VNERIFHFVARADWQAAGRRWAPPSLAAEGFVHCSDGAQLTATRARHLAGVEDLLVLEVDPARLDVPLVYEAAGDAGVFPHVYGSLPRMAVRGEVPLERAGDPVPGDLAGVPGAGAGPVRRLGWTGERRSVPEGPSRATPGRRASGRSNGP